jgi:threonine synthase
VSNARLGVTATFGCPGCRWSGAADPVCWRCPRCGEPIEFVDGGAAPRRLVPTPSERSGVWRYADWLGVEDPISLGEAQSPLITWPAPGGQEVLVKNESVLPTGSFKDRGAAVLVSWLRAQGAARVVVDSSGNAGAATAAYCARAGMGCEVFVPAYASAAKVAQAEAYGATVVRVTGTRADTARAAERRAAAADVPYASHQWHPAFLLGVETIAFELWEQCRRTLPDVIVMPLGSGSLVLGMARGLAALAHAGLLGAMPRLIGVQSDRCMPIACLLGAQAGRAGSDRSIAEGVQIADPPRKRQIVAALRAGGGTALAVGDDEIRAAQRRAAALGLLIEPTAAVGLAAMVREEVASASRAVVVVTGSGLKTLAGESRRTSGRLVA